MLVVIVIAAVAILAAVVFLATGRGGGLSRERSDYAPLELGPVSATDVALLRPPAGVWGYNIQATDEALDRIAASIRERDVRIVALEQLVTDLSRDHTPAIPLTSAYADARHRRRVPGPGETYSRPVPSPVAEPDETAQSEAAQSAAAQSAARADAAGTAEPPAVPGAAETAEYFVPTGPAETAEHSAPASAAETAESVAPAGAAETAEVPVQPGAAAGETEGIRWRAGPAESSGTGEAEGIRWPAGPAESPGAGAGETEGIRWPAGPADSPGPATADSGTATGTPATGAPAERVRARSNGVIAGREAASGPPPEQSHE